MRSVCPIGFFDSGVGGLSVWIEVQKLLPRESILYLADSKNAPYGKRTKADILQLCVKNTDFLLKNGCKAIVVACNTATTNAISDLRSMYDVPFIGVEPAIKPASLSTKTGRVGVLATLGTLASDLFAKTAETYTQDLQIFTQQGDGLVECVERGEAISEESKKLLKKYLLPMIGHNIDVLVLGCTHYPFLMPLIKDILPDYIRIIDSAYGVAKQTKAVLEKHKILNTLADPEYVFYANKELPSVSHFIPKTALKQIGEFKTVDF